MAALRAGVGNKARDGRDTGNQVCKESGRVRDGAQQDKDKVAGSMTADQFHGKLDQLRYRLQQVMHRMDTKATREGEDTPKLDQVDRGDIVPDGNVNKDELAGPDVNATEDELARPDVDMTEDELARPDREVTEDEQAGPDGSNTKEELEGRTAMQTRTSWRGRTST